MIHKQIRSLVPESQAYIELLRLEQKLDTVLMRKRLDIQETLKRPQKVLIAAEKQRLSHAFFSMDLDQEETTYLHQPSIPSAIRFGNSGRR